MINGFGGDTVLSECIIVLKSGLEFALANLTRVQHLHGQSNLAVESKEAC